MPVLAPTPDRYLRVRRALYETAAASMTGNNLSNVLRLLRLPRRANRSAGVTPADFSRACRDLMLLTALPAIRFYDTGNWQEVGSLPDVPPGASLYYPSPDWKHGIAVLANGDVALWDAPSRRQTAKIDIDGELSAVSFSPDDSMVATTSGPENKNHSSTFHLRIWNIVNGEMIEELLPVEYTAHDDIGTPMWWQDAR